jgi:hypothetical protein
MKNITRIEINISVIKCLRGKIVTDLPYGAERKESRMKFLSE